MAGKNSPSKQKSFQLYQSKQYCRGASRALEVGLRTASTAKLDATETVLFLEALRDRLAMMLETKDFDEPLLDRAVSGTLLDLSKQARMI